MYIVYFLSITVMSDSDISARKDDRFYIRNPDMKPTLSCILSSDLTL